MRARLFVIAVLVLFDLGVALAASLSVIAPPVAVGLLLTNPLVLILEHQVRARRAAAGPRRRS